MPVAYDPMLLRIRAADASGEGGYTSTGYRSRGAQLRCRLGRRSSR